MCKILGSLGINSVKLSNFKIFPNPGNNGDRFLDTAFDLWFAGLFTFQGV